jgi:hypothetical protein
MANSAIQVKAAFKSRVDAIPSLAQVQRTWTYPTREPERRWVMIGGISWDSSEWATNRSREETFRIAVAVNLQMTAATAEEAETAAAALMADIEDILDSAPKIIPSVVTAGFMPKSLLSIPSTEAIEAQFEGEAVFTARFRY